MEKQKENETQDLPGGKGEKKVEYIELFFDLIFVFTLRTINALFHDFETEFPPLPTLFSFFFLMLVALQVWYFATMYFNRYGRKSLRDYLMILASMFFLYYMSFGANLDWQKHYLPYCIAWALILLNLAYRNWDKRKRGPQLDELDRKILGNNVFIESAEAGIILLSIPVQAFFGPVLAPAALLFGYTARAFEYRYYKKRTVDFPHLSERVLLLVILTFGEMIIGISEFFHGGSNILLNLFAFLTVVGMFLQYGFYFDNILEHHKRTSGLGFLSLHVVLICSINSVTIALEFFSREGMAQFPRLLFLLLSMISYYILLVGVDRYAKDCFRSMGRLFFCTGALILLYVPAVLFLGRSPFSAITITMLYVFANFTGILILYRKKTGRKLELGGYLE